MEALILVIQLLCIVIDLHQTNIVCHHYSLKNSQKKGPWMESRSLHFVARGNLPHILNMTLVLRNKCEC